ncbi:MAG TPA: hypothetical protein VND64_11825 [Pirellulales bacterium]|nr:hypothetical protein [Pirellulales bacterium]
MIGASRRRRAGAIHSRSRVNRQEAKAEILIGIAPLANEIGFHVAFVNGLKTNALPEQGSQESA